MNKIKTIIFATLIILFGSVLISGLGKADSAFVEETFGICFSETNPTKCDTMLNEVYLGDAIHYGILILIAIPLLIVTGSIVLDYMVKNKKDVLLKYFEYSDEEDDEYYQYLMSRDIQFSKKNRSKLNELEGRYVLPRNQRFAPRELVSVNSGLVEINQLSSINEAKYLFIYKKMIVSGQIKFVAEMCLAD